MNNLEKERAEIDNIDRKLLSLLQKRFNLVLRIGKIKKENNLKAIDLKREVEVLELVSQKAEKLGLTPAFIKNIWKLFFMEAHRLEK